MEQIIAKLLSDFEDGKMSRRQLIQSLALSTASAVALAPAASAAEGRILKATNVNHISYQVADYAKTRDFFAGLFGMQVSEDTGKECRLGFGDTVILVRTRPTGTPRIDHIAFTVEGWEKDKVAMGEELKRRGIAVRRSDPTGFHISDPDGYEIQFGGPLQ